MLSVLKSKFPALSLRLKALTGRLYDADIERFALGKSGARVISGPFRGMRYIEKANCSALTPKLLGTYERELQPFIEEIVASRPEHVIDIGSAEGYYAVGLALRLPDSQIHAFDIDEDALVNLATLARLNGVTDRVSINRECSFETFEGFKGSSFVVVCDIEGAEKTLLDPLAAAALKQCDLLVEIHDGASSTSIHDTLYERFAPSHTLTFVPYDGRSSADAENAPWLGHPLNRQRAVDEQRTFGIEWGFFRHKADARSAVSP